MKKNKENSAKSIVFKLTVAFFLIMVGIFSWMAVRNKNSPPKLSITTDILGTPSAEAGSSSPSPSSDNSLIPEKKDMQIVSIKTNLGEIKIQTYNNDAPKAAENFVSLAQKGFYNNVVFHRVIKGFMIQGGDPSGNGTGGPGYQFADELNPNTESYKAGYKKGVVAMANSGPNTNGSQFFIMLEDYPLPNNYTIFGKVVSGQEVVDAIGQVKTDGQDKPLQPVVMEKVTVEE